MPLAAITDVPMPRLSDSMEDGTIVTWLKAPGDAVAVSDPLAEIETDKATVLYESDIQGRLIEIVAPEGATVPVGDPIARIGPSDAVADVGGARPSPSRPEGSKPMTGGITASPVARRLAADHGLNLVSIAGTGPNGRIVKADVERAIKLAPAAGVKASGDARAPANPAPNRPPTAPARPHRTAPLEPAEPAQTAKGTTEVIELTTLQQTVAQRMAQSKATVPHFYLETQIDMSQSVAARTRIKASAREGEVVPSFNDMVVKACAIALRESRRANGAYRDGSFELYSRVNIGIAVAAEDALAVPTVFDADRKGLCQIAAETSALAARVRNGTVTPAELSGGTFTVSNLGGYGVTNFAAVINPPQAAILAVGAIAEQPLARNGEISIGHVMRATLACDHRILYGADGAKLLARIRELLEAPLGLAL